MTTVPLEDLLRDLAPQVLGALLRRHGRFDDCEDAVQHALIAAARQWPGQGLPGKPLAWLTTVATRSLIDYHRADDARRRREAAVILDPTSHPPAAPDDTLTLLFLCCHPALSEASQLALTLRAVGGLSTAQIAAAFLVPEDTMSQRIRRAKQRIRDTGTRFEPPAGADYTARLAVVLHVLYLIFNEGYTDLGRPDLAAEAIRLARLTHRLLPGEGEVAGLLALMLLTEARRLARTDEAGFLVPLDEQDRSRWDRAAIAEGQTLLTRTLGSTAIGPYQIQAAIAAIHDEAPTAAGTDWPQILALYDVLTQIAPSPMATLSRAVAIAHVHGPLAALTVIGSLEEHNHRLEAVRAHLLEQAGDRAGAHDAYLRAARSTANRPEQHYLTRRAARLR